MLTVGYGESAIIRLFEPLLRYIHNAIYVLPMKMNECIYHSMSLRSSMSIIALVITDENENICGCHINSIILLNIFKC